jgi:sorting and assembly machinery component 37/metaxin
LSFPNRYIVPIQLKKNAKARLEKYNVEIIRDDVGLPQNEKEEMKDLLKSGWHHVNQVENFKTIAIILTWFCG